MPEWKSNTVRLLPDREQRDILLTLRLRCAALRNRANYLCRQAFFARQSVPSYTRLCSLLIREPAYHALPSDMAQEVLKKLAGDWASFFALQELYREGKLDKPPRIPGYYKDRRTGQTLPSPVIPVKSPRSWSCDAQTIGLTLPQDMRANGRLVIPYRGVLRHRGAFKTLEILEEAGGYYARLSVEKETPRRKARPYKPAAGDIGPRMGLAVVIDADSQLLFGFYELWKDYKYWSKRIAEAQSQLATRDLKTSQRLEALYTARRRRLEAAQKALARQLALLLKQRGVTHFYVGYPKGIREDLDFGPELNKLLHNFWCYRKFLRILGEALARVGIILIPVDEMHSSKFCSVCGCEGRRIERHLFVCPKGHKLHADLNAAWNILIWNQDYSKDSCLEQRGVEATPGPSVYRWDGHRWPCEITISQGWQAGRPKSLRLPKVA